MRHRGQNTDANRAARESSEVNRGKSGEKKKGPSPTPAPICMMPSGDGILSCSNRIFESVGGRNPLEGNILFSSEYDGSLQQPFLSGRGVVEKSIVGTLVHAYQDCEIHVVVDLRMWVDERDLGPLYLI